MPTKSAEAEKLYKYMIGGRRQCLVIEACANEGVGANEQVVRRLPGRRPYFHTSVRASFQLYNFRLSVLTFMYTSARASLLLYNFQLCKGSTTFILQTEIRRPHQLYYTLRFLY